MLAASFSPFLSEAAVGGDATADGASDVDGKRLLRSRLIFDGGFALEAEPVRGKIEDKLIIHVLPGTK